mmetsp:Transcript_49263/g.114520  ORF Transcript_49263/g.114520 Transcript_49263/m.114520 type:complete len:86 (-) Transcript_49263:126-383(-)
MPVKRAIKPYPHLCLASARSMKYVRGIVRYAPLQLVRARLKNVELSLPASAKPMQPSRQVQGLPTQDGLRTLWQKHDAAPSFGPV